MMIILLDTYFTDVTMITSSGFFFGALKADFFSLFDVE